MVVNSTVVTQWYVFFYSFPNRCRNYTAEHIQARSTLRKPWLLLLGGASNSCERMGSLRNMAGRFRHVALPMGGDAT